MTPAPKIDWEKWERAFQTPPYQHYCLALLFLDRKKPHYQRLTSRQAVEKVWPKRGRTLYRFDFLESRPRPFYICELELHGADSRRYLLGGEKTQVIVALEMKRGESLAQAELRAQPFLTTITHQIREYFRFLNQQPLVYTWR